MSRFLIEEYKTLIPYTPGEQPKERKYIKLNTNESPFPPSEKAIKSASIEAESLQLYPDPECRNLIEKASEIYGISKDEIVFTNGSDEILNFAFMAFCNKQDGAVFPNITYGFYPVFAKLNGVNYKEIPLKDDFTIDINDYIGVNKVIFLANPNAPTGIALSVKEIEKIIVSNPEKLVVVDKAYVDFGAESCVPLIKKYDNLLVTQTFSKSRSMAGARLGVGIACKEIIKDINTIRYSTNPYNVNRATMSAGIGVLCDDEYTKKNCQEIIRVGEWTKKELKKLGFELTNSLANFVFAKHAKISGEKIYSLLREKGILVRHFSLEKIKDYNRITIGTMEQMQALVNALCEIMEENV